VIRQTDRVIFNIDTVEQDFKTFMDRPIRLSTPLNGKESVIDSNSFDSFRNAVTEIAKEFPHKRAILTYKTNNEEILMDLHPVTGAA